MQRRTWTGLLAAFALGALVAVGGCKATFTDPRVPVGTEHSLWRSFYVGGLVGHAEVDVRDVCASGRAREVQTGEDALTLGATIITLGIYAPRRIYVTCGKEPRR